MDTSDYIGRPVVVLSADEAVLRRELRAISQWLIIRPEERQRIVARLEAESDGD